MNTDLYHSHNYKRPLLYLTNIHVCILRTNLKFAVCPFSVVKKEGIDPSASAFSPRICRLAPGYRTLLELLAIWGLSSLRVLGKYYPMTFSTVWVVPTLLLSPCLVVLFLGYAHSYEVNGFHLNNFRIYFYCPDSDPQPQEHPFNCSLHCSLGKIVGSLKVINLQSRLGSLK